MGTEHTLIRDARKQPPRLETQGRKEASSSSCIVLEVTEVKLKRGLTVIITYV